MCWKLGEERLLETGGTGGEKKRLTLGGCHFILILIIPGHKRLNLQQREVVLMKAEIGLKTDCQMSNERVHLLLSRL